MFQQEVFGAPLCHLLNHLIKHIFAAKPFCGPLLTYLMYYINQLNCFQSLLFASLALYYG